MKTRSLAIVAACSLALLLLALLDPWESKKVPPVDRLVSAEQLSTLSKLRIVDSSGETFAIEKVGGRWQAQDPRLGPLDADAVRELLSVLGMLRSSRQAPPSELSAPAADAPAIAMESSEGRDVLRFGGLSGDGRLQWVAVNESGPVYLVESYLLREILDLRGRLLSPRLLPQDFSWREPLVVRHAERWFAIDEGQVSWPGQEDSSDRGLSSAGAGGLREAMADLVFEESLPEGMRCQADARTYLVEQGSKRTKIQYCGSCKADRVALTTGNRSGCVAAGPWRYIQAVLESPSTLLGLAVLPSREVPGAFRLICGQRKLDVNPSEVDLRRLGDWWRRLDSAGIRVVEAITPPTRCTLSTDAFALGFGEEGGRWFAFPARSPASLPVLLRELDPEAFALLQVDAVDFLSLDLIAEEALNATDITVAEGGKEHKLVRGELASLWTHSEARLSDLAASQWALALRTELSNLKALAFVREKDQRGPPATSGRRLSVTFALPASTTEAHHEVWVVKGVSSSEYPGSCWAKVDELPPAWISAQACQGLLVKSP